MSETAREPVLNRPPVRDWQTDWDHLDPRWKENPFPIWDELRGCPIAHTDRFQGAWLPTRHEDVKAIAYDTEHFSSRYVVVRDQKLAEPNPAPPITSDPPHHKPAKRLLLPFFTPAAMEALKPKTQRICNELIDAFIEDGRCDAAQQYARHIPVRIIAYMLGVPEKDSDQFIQWIHESLELGIADPVVGLKAIQEIKAYFAHHVALRRAGKSEADPDGPEKDLITLLMEAELEGAPVSDDHVLGTLQLLLVAGIDTTWSAIGATLWHLGTHADDRRRLVDEPDLMPVAIEEFLRAYAPVTMAREVQKDVTLSGCPMKAGEMVLLSFPAANRDPEEFDDADKVIIDREVNRHSAFGLGIHRCVGSNMARMEMTVAVEEWLKRIPDYRIDGDVKWSDGTVRGPRQLPVAIG